ncbi:MAG: hypothetical protein KC620_12765, partial [Myxococcales bacterium]|nr:hypothetical protein [Myxococcales bacterium]
MHVALDHADDRKVDRHHRAGGAEGGGGGLLDAERAVELLQGHAEAPHGAALVVGGLEALAGAHVERQLAGRGAQDAALGFAPRRGVFAIGAEHAGGAFAAFAVERGGRGDGHHKRRADAAGQVVVGQAAEFGVHRGDGDLGDIAQHAAGQAQ